MAIHRIEIVGLCVLFIILHIDSNSAEQYRVQKKITYHDDGQNGTMACIHFPKVQIRSYKSDPMEFSDSRRSLGKKHKKRHSKKTKPSESRRRAPKRHTRGKRFNPLQSLLPHLPWIPKIPGLPPIGLPPRLGIPMVPKVIPIKPLSVLSEIGNLIPQHILSSDKAISWSYNDGNTTINVNYNPSGKSKNMIVDMKLPSSRSRKTDDAYLN